VVGALVASTTSILAFVGIFFILVLLDLMFFSRDLKINLLFNIYFLANLLFFSI